MRNVRPRPALSLLNVAKGSQIYRDQGSAATSVTPPKHNELPMVIEMEGTNNVPCNSHIHPPSPHFLVPGFGTKTKHSPCRFLGLEVTKLSPLFWHSMVFTQLSLWEMCGCLCLYIPWCQQGEQRQGDLRRAGCSRDGGISTSTAEWWWFHFQQCISKNTDITYYIFSFSISLWWTHLGYVLVHTHVSTQYTVLSARKGGYVANT